MSQALRLLWFNLATDADATGQGFTTDWINALAPYCDTIDVLTMRQGRLAVAENVRVYSAGKEKGYSEIRRADEFYRILRRLLNEGHYDACFAHMQPLFALMAAPLLLPRGIPMTLWYAHKTVTLKLRMAEKVVQRVVTSSPEGFRLNSPKVRVIGQGIDTALFRPAASPPACFTILSVSRIRPVKHLETMIETARLLRDADFDFCLRIVGEVYPEDRAYAQELQERVAEHDLSPVIHFVGPVAYHDTVAEYQNASLLLNLSSTGSVDKAVLEAMACGLPVITSNEAFRPILAQWQPLLLVSVDQPQRSGTAYS